MSAETSRSPTGSSERLGWPRISSSARVAQRAPPRASVFYLGGITLFLLLMQVASGILLVLYYQPDAAQAYASVERIVGGDPVRQPRSATSRLGERSLRRVRCSPTSSRSSCAGASARRTS